MMSEYRKLDRYIFADGTKCFRNCAKVPPSEDVNGNAAVSLRKRIDESRHDHCVAQVTKGEDQARIALLEVTPHPLDPSFDKTG
jgi:hypothetical protein